MASEEKSIKSKFNFKSLALSATATVALFGAGIAIADPLKELVIHPLTHNNVGYNSLIRSVDPFIQNFLDDTGLTNKFFSAARWVQKTDAYKHAYEKQNGPVRREEEVEDIYEQAPHTHVEVDAEKDIPSNMKIADDSIIDKPNTDIIESSPIPESKLGAATLGVENPF